MRFFKFICLSDGDFGHPLAWTQCTAPVHCSLLFVQMFNVYSNIIESNKKYVPCIIMHIAHTHTSYTVRYDDKKKIQRNKRQKTKKRHEKSMNDWGISPCYFSSSRFLFLLDVRLLSRACCAPLLLCVCVYESNQFINMLWLWLSRSYVEWKMEEIVQT